MGTTNVTVRVDREVKTKADELFNKLGLNFSTAINMFLLKAIRSNSIPFDVSLNSHQADTDREAIEALLHQLLSSAQAQKTISTIHEGSPSDISSLLPTDNVEQFL